MQCLQNLCGTFRYYVTFLGTFRGIFHFVIRDKYEQILFTSNPGASDILSTMREIQYALLYLAAESDSVLRSRCVLFLGNMMLVKDYFKNPCSKRWATSYTKTRIWYDVLYKVNLLNILNKSGSKGKQLGRHKDTEYYMF